MKTKKGDIVVVNSMEEATLWLVTKVDGFTVSMREIHPEIIYKEQIVDVSMLKKPTHDQLCRHIIHNSK